MDVYYNQRTNKLPSQEHPSSSSLPSHLYNFWQGDATFLLNGYIRYGPRLHFSSNMLLWIWILLLGIAHVSYILPKIYSLITASRIIIIVSVICYASVVLSGFAT